MRDSVAVYPRVSIGLPVFNGENYLEEALQSIITQTFADFELIISDNASTDRTSEICVKYARQDPRIRYYRSEQNVGAAPNFNRTVAFARGTYFKWAAHDDLIAPNFLERCVAILDADPTVVLCHSQVKEIGANGDLVRNHGVVLPNAGSHKVHKRFADLILIDHPCHDVFGLMRLDVLRQTPQIASYIGSDRVLLAELALRGRLYQIPENLFISRCHSQQSVLAMPLHRRRHWFDTSLTDGRSLPHWNYWYEYYQCLNRVPLSIAEKRACYQQLVRYPSRAALQLTKDLITVISPEHVELVKQNYPHWLCKLRQIEEKLFALVHRTSKKTLRNHY